jgi:parallel beta-helix repeat protein
MTLIGENKDKAIIDGTGNGTIFDVTANNVSISDFTIQNCGCSCQGYYGFYVEKYHDNINITNNNMAGQSGILGNSIKLDLVQNVLIERNNLTQSLDWCILATNSSNVYVLDNNVAHNFYGVQIENSTGVVLSGNNITNSDFGGVHVSRCNNGTFFGNSFSSDSISFSRSNNSLIFHNNFLDIQLQFWTSNSTNLWDNGVEGNYWSNYTGADANLDGIGDTPQVIDATNIDHYPLMGAFGNFNTTYGPQVDFISNSSISDIDFSVVNSSQAKLKFNVTGENGTHGFSRICIPKGLINGSYVVTFDGEVIAEPLSRILPSSNDTYTYLYISYTHSQHLIEITGTTAIPEFPTLVITALILIYGLLTTAAYRRKYAVK